MKLEEMIEKKQIPKLYPMPEGRTFYLFPHAKDSVVTEMRVLNVKGTPTDAYVWSRTEYGHRRWYLTIPTRVVKE
jgi:hypothetical protein